MINIEEVLKYSKSQNLIIEVNSDTEETTKFSAGIVQLISEDFVLLNHFSCFGMYDGYQLIKKDDIYQTSYDTKYCKKITALTQKFDKKHELLDISLKNNLVVELLNVAKNKGFVVTIELLNSNLNDTSGIVVDLNKNNVFIKNLDEHGNDDGFTTLCINDITSICCDDDYGIAVLYLSQNKLI